MSITESTITPRIITFVFAGLLVFLAASLFSCGQKGPLFLLEEQPEQTLVETESEVAAEQEAEQETETTVQEELTPEEVLQKSKAPQEKKKNNN